MVKTRVWGWVVIVLGVSGCAHRVLPDCEAHLVPINVPSVPIDLPVPTVDLPVLEPHP